jgi:hypothetical protein
VSVSDDDREPIYRMQLASIRERCKHEFRGQHNDTHVVDGKARVVAMLRCLDCRAWLSLGPAVDTIATFIELRAAEIAAGGQLSAAESDGYQGREVATVCVPNPHWRPGMGRMLMTRTAVDIESEGWQAGYLAAAIVAHDKEQG